MNAPVVAVNTAAVAPGLAVTIAGAISVGFVLLTAIDDPPAGAGFVSVTVHKVDPLTPMLAGAQEIEETAVGANRLKSALATSPFKDAVTLAVWFVAILAPAVAVTLPVRRPFRISNAEGVVRLGLLLLMATTLKPTDG